MSSIILDDDLRAKLNGLNAPVVVNDSTGRSVGCFLPRDEYIKYLYAKAKEQVTDEEIEELRRLSRETGGRPLAEIWKRLEEA